MACMLWVIVINIAGLAGDLPSAICVCGRKGCERLELLTMIVERSNTAFNFFKGLFFMAACETTVALF